MLDHQSEKKVGSELSVNWQFSLSIEY